MNYPLQCVNQSRHLATLKGQTKEAYRWEMMDERAGEIATYLNEDKGEALNKMMDGIKLTRDLWLQMNPQTEEAIYEFYTKMNTYIYELMYNECTDSRAAQLEALFERIEKYKPRSILVYGAGVGSEAIPIAEMYPDISITVADIPSPHFKFCLHRFFTRQLKQNAFLVKLKTYGAEIPAKYDMIVCFDVFEHVADAEALAKNFYVRLNDGGVLLAEFMFNKNSGKKPEKQNTHPLHIERNKQGMLIRGAHWKSYLRQLGFLCDWKTYGSQWIKELRKPGFYEATTQIDKVLEGETAG